MISGEPGSGKTHFAKKLADKYLLPYINIRDIANELLEDEEVLKRVEYCKEYQLEATKKSVSEENKWRKKDKAKEISFTEESYYKRIPNDLLWKAV